MIQVGPSKTSGMMFNRRHRGWIQTSIILILIISLGYGFYLYNILQVKVKHLDTKAERYQSQHRSLSSQLQVVYEDRSRLENSLHKEKQDHENTKQEMDRSQEQHQLAMEELEKEHKLKLDEISEKHQQAETDLENARKQVLSYVEKENVMKEKQDKEGEEVRNQKSVLEQSNADLQDKLNQLKNAHDSLVISKSELQRQLEQSQIGSQSYLKLRALLSSIGTDVVKLGHQKLSLLAPEDRKWLFEHFGGSPSNAGQMESLHQQSLKDNETRRLAIQQRDQDKLQRDQMIAARNERQQHPESITDPKKICFLPKAFGTCSGQESRYYYEPSLSSCTHFVYSGCGGNTNNFATHEECEKACQNLAGQAQAPLGNQPGMRDPIMVNQDDKIAHVDNKRPDDNLIGGQNQNHPDNNGQIQDIGAAGEREGEVHQPDGGEDEEEPLPQDPNNGVVPDNDVQGKQNDEDRSYRDTEDEREMDDVARQEERAKQEEQQAQFELDQQKQREKDENGEEDPGLQEDQQKQLNEENAGKDPIEKLRELQEQQVVMVDEQAKDIDQLVKHQQQVEHKEEKAPAGEEHMEEGQLRGRVFEEEAANLAKDEGEEDKYDDVPVAGDAGRVDDPDAQVDVPPAGAHEAGAPHMVMNAPLINDGQNNQGENEYQEPNFDGGNREAEGGAEEEEEEDEEEEGGEEDNYEDEGDPHNNKNDGNDADNKLHLPPGEAAEQDGGYAEERGGREDADDQRHQEALAVAMRREM